MTNGATYPEIASEQPHPGLAPAYIPGLDGIRALAFLLVFAYHATAGTPSARYVPGALGVTVFFFLSGYLITTLLRREMARTGTLSLRSFYARRALRISVPLILVYAITTVFARLCLHGVPDNALGCLSTLFYFFNYAALLTRHAHVPGGLGVAWSLSVEEHFYILFPLACLAMLRRGLSRRQQAAALLALCVADLAWRLLLLSLLKHNAEDWFYTATDARFDSILWGAVLAFGHNPVFDDPPIVPRRWAFPAFLAASAVLLSPFPAHGLLYRETLRSSVQGVALYFIFTFILANSAHWSVAWLEWLPLRYIGWTSYVLYLTHDTILAALKPRLSGNVGTLALLGFLYSLAFASLFRYAVELPLQRWRGRFRNAPGLALKPRVLRRPSGVPSA